MLTLIEISDRYGLARGEEVVVPATYDAVWPLLGAFWGIRAGNVFGVLASDGSEVCPCVLPATYWGFAELRVDEQLQTALDTEDSFVEYLQANFLGLHARDYHTGLFKPAKWWAEEVSPHLVNEHGELRLYSPDQCLILNQAGSWWWHDETSYPGVTPLVCATNTPVMFSNIQPQVTREFTEATTQDMVYWRLKLTTHRDRDPTEEEMLDLWWPQYPKRRFPNPGKQSTTAPEKLALEPITREKAEKSWAAWEAKSNPTAALPPAVRLACEELLLKTIRVVDEESRPLVNTLIHLAWVWANGFMPCRYQLLKLIDLYKCEAEEPYYMDFYLFHPYKYKQKTLATLYKEHKLERLFPLLRTGAIARADANR